MRPSTLSGSRLSSHLVQDHPPSLATQTRAGTSRFGDTAGLNNIGQALATDANHNVYVGGNFGTAGGVSVSGVARWNGEVFAALGTGMNGPVYALAVDGSGNLYAGGSFSTGRRG